MRKKLSKPYQRSESFCFLRDSVKLPYKSSKKDGFGRFSYSAVRSNVLLRHQKRQTLSATTACILLLLSNLRPRRNC